MNKIDEIKRLSALFNEGAITKEEFNLFKKKVLDSIAKPNLSKHEYINDHNPSIRQNIPIKQPMRNVKSGETKKIAAKTYRGSINASLVLIVIFVIFWFTPSITNSVSSSSSSNNNNSSTYQKEKEKKVCNRCKGTGIEICNLCGGSGENNLGMTCGCVTLYANTITMGQTPSHPPLQWTCTKCKGSGYSDY